MTDLRFLSWFDMSQTKILWPSLAFRKVLFRIDPNNSQHPNFPTVEIKFTSTIGWINQTLLVIQLAPKKISNELSKPNTII
jgi:hypothetical protein